MPTQLRRDPFARATLYRERVNLGPCECRNCGTTRTTKSGKPLAYWYAWKSDADTRSVRSLMAGKGAFCSVGCFTSLYSL